MDRYELGSVEEVKQFLKEAYPDKMVLEDMDEFERIKLIGAQTLANELLLRMGE